MDALIIVAILTSFATFCTAHVALAFVIGRRGPWWRGALSLVVVPLAVYFGVRDRLRLHVALWAVALTLYVAARVAAARVS